MINTKKKIHIYNRFRTIYASKNRYYIRYNKKYIDLYTIIKKADTKAVHHIGGGGIKSDKRFLTQELADIKNGIVIFKLLMDDKQSEAINIYINLIDLINSKRELIINKINTYPQNHFDNELNKAAMITYVKSVIYNHIFDNYLKTIIPKIDLKDLIKGNDDPKANIIENIIKALLHYDEANDEKVAQDIMNKIEKYKDIIISSIESNKLDYDKLKNIIGKYIDAAIKTVENAKNADEADEAADTDKADEADEAADTDKQDEIKKVIYEDMDAIKEGLDNLDNKDYVDILLPILEKEIIYYHTIGGIDKTEITQFFNDIKTFLEKYKEPYNEYIVSNTEELGEKNDALATKNPIFNSKKTELAGKETELATKKSLLKEKQENLDKITKEKEEKDKNGQDTEPQQGDGGDGEGNQYPLKTEITKIKGDYSKIINEIRELKICINGLDKDIEKINKRIKVIEKKKEQYTQFIIKIGKLSDNLSVKIAGMALPATPAIKTDTEAKNNNITSYKKKIENVIFNIKSKILYNFIMNYIQYCDDLNESRRDNKGYDKYVNLNTLIKGLYQEQSKDTISTDATKPATVATKPDATKPATVATQSVTDATQNVTDAPRPDTGAAQPDNPQEAVPVTDGGGARVRASVCAYLTDVEGNLDFFEKYVRISKVIEWVDSKKNRLRFKQKDSMFVFGGDCQDRGIGDIRFVNLLLNLKNEYPERVEFIIGNRDANKIRIYSELSEKIADEAKYLAKYDNFPYWVNKDERITLRKYLENNNYKINTVSRLKYILDYTMGSFDSFDKRRRELSIILNKSPDSISDKDIVSSFLNSVSPHPANIKNTNDNYMLKYLKSGKIAYIFGEHIFVHGAINKNNMGYIPNNKNRVDNVEKWVSGLNKWFQKDLKEYMANPEYGGISKRRKGYRIIDYAVPSDNKSVVYSDNLKNGNGQYINSKVIKYLNKGGIHSIISGHRPHGDCPLVLRSKKLTAVSADTSYSKKGHRSKWGIDNRGNAVSEVLLYLNGDIQIHGILQDNRKYNYIINNKDTKPDKSHHKYDKYIGLQLKNNYWVKNVKSGKNTIYLISYAKGFEYDDKWIAEAELLKLL
jgi:hypothetical protein